jgi:hypothetical protein
MQCFKVRGRFNACRFDNGGRRQLRNGYCRHGADYTRPTSPCTKGGGPDTGADAGLKRF